MPKLVIDGKEIEVEDGITILQACEQAGVEIPRFCYHERLSIAGNCRMCLVELERAPKPVASCSIGVADGMVVHTSSERVEHARKGVMEFLLINHPLDCPICDQGGECDLQDQAFKYGKGESTYNEPKRAVEGKNLGPLVKTEMTRCIHCTRCIRFSQDIAGIEELGAVGRGEHMEITSYLERNLESELSGNVIDLCPVGALTSKPYEFKARNWELKRTESIDVMDALGSNIRVDSRGGEVMRILPINNDDINEEWISDKTRFAYDGLKYQRLDRPYLRSGSRLREISWQEAILTAASKLKHVAADKIGVICGDLCDLESMFMLKTLCMQLGVNALDANQHGYNFDLSTSGNYLFNTTIAGIDKADCIVLVGANPRKTSPVLNARISRRVRLDKVPAYRLGEGGDQTYPITELGGDIKVLDEVLGGKHELSKQLKSSNNPLFIIGDAIYSRSDSTQIMALVQQILEQYNGIRSDWNGFNILHNNAAMVGALELGLVSKAEHSAEIVKKARNNKLELLYLNNADEIEIGSLKDVFVIYQGHHGDKNARYADLILPGCAYTEKDGLYINTEGRPQYARAAVSPLGLAKPDWQIILDIMQECKLDCTYNDLSSLRSVMVKNIDMLQHIGEAPKQSAVVMNMPKNKGSSNKIEEIEHNFYMSNAICRASVTMAKCVAAQRERSNHEHDVES